MPEMRQSRMPVDATVTPREVMVRAAAVALAHARDLDDARMLLEVLFAPAGPVNGSHGVVKRDRPPACGVCGSTTFVVLCVDQVPRCQVCRVAWADRRNPPRSCCGRGHPMVPPNRWVDMRGRNRCRACERLTKDRQKEGQP